MRINKCWFCSSNIYPGHGINFCRNDNLLFTFCRKKCFVSFKNKKNPRKTRWTKAFRLLHKKDLHSEKILHLEKRTDEPILIDKQILNQAVESVPQFIKQKKEKEVFYIANRIYEQKERQKEAEVRFIEKHRGILDSKVLLVEKEKKGEKECEMN